MDDKKTKFFPQLAIDTGFFQKRICQTLYDVKPKAQSEQCVPYCAFGHWVLNDQLLYKMARNL